MLNDHAWSQLYFRPEGYRAILRFARECGYSLTNFKNFSLAETQPRLLLRHDLDHSIRSARVIAALEQAEGVTATYFVQIACPFYNLLAPESRGILREITAMGHEIGLHYEAARYLGDDGAAHLRCDLQLLEDIAEQKIVSASQHVPIASATIVLPEYLQEAYAPRFTQAPMSYISDSLMAWRQARPHELIQQRQSFQLLTHPMKWSQACDSLTRALQFARDEECRVIQANYHQIAETYAELLRQRERLDREFIAKRQVVVEAGR
jgi:hypothetical protein